MPLKTSSVWVFAFLVGFADAADAAARVTAAARDELLDFLWCHVSISEVGVANGEPEL